MSLADAVQMKGLGFWFVAVDIAVDGVHSFQHVAEDASPQAVGGEIAEEPLDHIQPRSTDGREVKVEAWVTFQPTLDGGMFVSRVVVNDQMELFVSRRGFVDQSQEHPLLMAVPLLA
jgi:hypothetical protein